MLELPPIELHTKIAEYVGVPYISVRACSRTLQARLGEDRSPLLWRAILPRGVAALVARFGHDPAGYAQGGHFACENGLLPEAQWLVMRAGPAASADGRHLFGARMAACVGHLATARWAARFFDLRPLDVCCRGQILSNACRSGYLDVAEWIFEWSAPTLSDLRSDNCGALVGACAHGWLAFAQRIAAGLTTNDARAGSNAALCAACEGGHLDVAQWLAERFGLDAKDDVLDVCWGHSPMPPGALRVSIQAGHLEVVQWLVTRFKLTRNEIGDAAPGLDGWNVARHVLQWLDGYFRDS